MNKKQRILMLGMLVLATVIGALGAVTVMSVAGDGNDSQVKASAKQSSEEFKPDKTTLESCTDNELKCLEQAMGNLAYEQGAKEALTELDTHIGTGDPLETNCHRLTHAVGSGALARQDGDVGAAFVEGTATCWSGYYHGVLEQSFVGVEEDEVADAATKVCTSDEVRATQFLHYQCVHGLGHGLMLHLNYELPKALEVCEAFEDSWQSTSCDGGVFMENVNASTGGRSKYLKDDDLIYPCNDVTERHKLYCYLMVTSRIGEENGFDWQDMARHCREEAEEDWRNVCFQSYGRDASGQSRKDLAFTAEKCSLVGKDWIGDCAYGAARDMVSEDAGPDRAAKLCAKLEAGGQARCAEGVGTILNTLNAEESKRISECERSLSAQGLARLVAECLRGAAVPTAAAAPASETAA